MWRTTTLGWFSMPGVFQSGFHVRVSHALAVNCVRARVVGSERSAAASPPADAAAASVPRRSGHCRPSAAQTGFRCSLNAQLVSHRSDAFLLQPDQKKWADRSGAPRSTVKKGVLTAADIELLDKLLNAPVDISATMLLPGSQNDCDTQSTDVPIFDPS